MQKSIISVVQWWRLQLGVDLLDESLESFLFTTNITHFLWPQKSVLVLQIFFNSSLLILPYGTEKSATDVCIQNIQNFIVVYSEQHELIVWIFGELFKSWSLLGRFHPSIGHKGS